MPKHVATEEAFVKSYPFNKRALPKNERSHSPPQRVKSRTRRRPLQRLVPIIVVVIMVIAVILAVPVTLVIMPSVLVAVIVRMTPICARVRWMIPAPGHPDIAASGNAPVSVNPRESRARRRRTPFIPKRRRSAANDDADLRKGRSSSSGKYGRAEGSL